MPILKSRGAFFQKRAVIKFGLRTLNITYGLTDLDKLSICYHRTWSPKHVLRDFYPSQSMKLFYMMWPFYTDSMATAYERIHCSTDYSRHLSSLRFSPLYARSIEHLKKHRNPKYLVFETLLRGDRGRTTSMSQGKCIFSTEFSVQWIFFHRHVRERQFIYHARMELARTCLDMKYSKHRDSENGDFSSISDTSTC